MKRNNLTLKFEAGVTIMILLLTIFVPIYSAKENKQNEKEKLNDNIFPIINQENEKYSPKMPSQETAPTVLNSFSTDMQQTWNFRKDKVFTINMSLSSNDKNLSVNLPKFAPGEIILKFKSNVNIIPTLDKNSVVKTGVPSIDILNEQYDVSSMDRIFKNRKETADDTYGFSRIYKLKIPKDSSIPTIVESYASNPNIEYAEPNYLSYTTYVPNDPRLDEQWAHNNIHSFNAWDVEQGDTVTATYATGTGIITVDAGGGTADHTYAITIMYLSENFTP